MSNNTYFKLPRLYIADDLKGKDSVALESEQTHYIKNVLRLGMNDQCRIFDGVNGEFLTQISALSKKEATLEIMEKIAEQPKIQRRCGLIFTPIKKARLDILIEKAVELVVTDFYPVLTQNTDIRKINAQRLNKQILEAAEQCERFTIPILHPLQNYESSLHDLSNTMAVFSCLERFDGTKEIAELSSEIGDFACFIGPEGGFTDAEKSQLHKNTTAISLGDTVLRTETAAIKALILLQER